ncbi:MAG: NERD domain-containing protein [Gomphosphaeria aponina SAG 52.96 = DSM 107014]|uniref:NERD domain-containing protein n=1 Tax=Gomphosphaeria aponina SAG 52.96 = DSM 107014 TaxID=1521640 RepID=A0A941JVN9_9CHRO|nr:NERD domain-containing protein [Gomphosphaeria aponina SAG 52.96 = DSM 107014]
MAITIPQSIPSKASQGEKKLFNVFAEKLPDDFYVWYEPRIDDAKHPDFIILAPDFGLLVIEVKGWYPKDIILATTDIFKIETQKEDYGTTNKQKSPLRQAKDYLDTLLNQLQKYRVLTQQDGKYEGKLAFPIGWGAIMSNITNEQARNNNNNIQKVLPQPQVGYQNELLDWEKKDFSTEKLIDRLQGMFTVKFPFPTLTQEQINTIKGAIYPEIIIREQKATIKSVPNNFSLLPSDTVLTTLDTKQENLAKSIGDGHRIFFGVAGSGKTLLLIARAKLLINQNPNAKILVLCFNVSLASHLKSILHEDRKNPQYSKIEVTNFDQWAKLILGKLPAQVEGNRDEYIANLVLNKLNSYKDKWDAILVDEAHTFVPIWFKCCVKALKDSENGDLMIVADGSQSLYKRSDFTWKEVGVKAPGRTISKKFDLDKNYRNTIEILNGAWSLLNKIQEKQEILETEEITFPTIKPDLALRHGLQPQVYVASTVEQQEELVIKTIQNLNTKDFDWKDIAILYRQKNGNSLDKIINKLNQLNIPYYWVSKDDKSKSNYSQNREGVRLITCLSSLGLEFKAVLILWLEQFDDCVSNKQGSLLITRQLYVAMTRAQENLLLLGLQESKLINELKQSNDFEVIN